MRRAEQVTPVPEVAGIIQEIDPVAREIRLLTEGGVRVVDVPPECGVHLNGERVKLRLLQPLDQARAVVQTVGGRLVALSVHVSSAGRLHGPSAETAQGD
jgi:hypothetical protein